MSVVSQVVYDGTGLVLGRLASTAAKQSLLGKDVIIVNFDKILVTGSRENIITEWGQAARRGGHSLRGPFVPRKNTERILKRVIRGMLSYKQKRGLEALRRIRCYADVPEAYTSVPKQTLNRKVIHPTLALKEVS